MNFLFDIVFPKRCVGCKAFGTYLCSNCMSHIEEYQQFVCPVCLKESETGETHLSCKTQLEIDGLASGVVYKGVVKRLLNRVAHKPYLSYLSVIVGTIFSEMISQNELFMGTLPQQPIVMVIPLSRQKLKIRGYNQSEMLARSIAKDFNLQIITKSIKRTKDTKPQSSLDKSQKFENVLNSFQIDTRYAHSIKGKTVLLIDDFASSCATLRECAKVLKQSGARKVYGVVFAYAKQS